VVDERFKDRPKLPANPKRYAFFSTTVNTGLEVIAHSHFESSSAQAALAVCSTDHALVKPLLDAREKRQAELRTAFQALQKAYASGPEAQAVSGLRKQLDAAVKALDAAKGKSAKAAAAWRVAIKSGQDYRSQLADHKAAGDDIKAAEALVEMLLPEVQAAETAYTDGWQTQKDTWAADQHQQARKTESDLADRLVEGVISLALQVQAERDAGYTVNSLVAHSLAPQVEDK
jgi:hypothetical protein